MHVIPRLAQRAEGPHIRSSVTQTSGGVIRHADLRESRKRTWMIYPSTEGSLGALRQPRDDSAWETHRSGSNNSRPRSFQNGFNVRTKSFFFSRRQPLISFSREMASPAVLNVSK